MTQNSIFVSYSRKEYFFTESLVLHLQRHNIDAWFDVQQLEPGIGWKADIQQGLERCEALVLVASQASIASQYVNLEWQAALQAQKPIYVLLFEPVTLPAELSQPAALIDFTHDFERGINLLVKVIQERVSHHDPIPSVGERRLPPAVQRLTHLMLSRVILWWGLLLLSAVLLIRAVPVVINLFDPNQTYDAVPVFGLITTTVLVGLVLLDLWLNRQWVMIVRRLRRRENAPVQYWIKAWRFHILASLYIFFLLVACIFIFQSPLFLILLAIPFYVVITFNKQSREWVELFLNPELLRWCHLGNDVPYDWRILLNKGLLPEEMSVDVLYKIVETTDDNNVKHRQQVVTGLVVAVKGAKPTPKTYRMYAAPQIKEVEAYFKEVLKKNAFKEAQDAAIEPDYHIILLSPWTAVDEAQKLIQNHPKTTLPVLVLPTDLHQLPDITKVQLLDFRMRYEPQIASALQYLHTQDSKQRSVFSIAVLPVQLSNPFPLLELRGLQKTLLFASSLCIVSGIIGLICLPFSGITANTLLSAFASMLHLAAAIWLRKNAEDIGNLVPKSPPSLRIISIAIMLLMVGTFILGIQPSISRTIMGAQVDIVGYGLGWRILGTIFMTSVGMAVVAHVALAIRRGQIGQQMQNKLGLPSPTRPSIIAQVRQICLIAVFYALAALVSTSVFGSDGGYEALMRDGNFPKFLIGAVILTAVICATIWSTLSYRTMVQDDHLFAFSAAPALRYHLGKFLRKSDV